MPLLYIVRDCVSVWLFLCTLILHLGNGHFGSKTVRTQDTSEFGLKCAEVSEIER